MILSLSALSWTPAQAGDVRRTGYILNPTRETFVLVSGKATGPVRLSWIDLGTGGKEGRTCRHPFFHVIEPGRTIMLELPKPEAHGFERLDFDLLADHRETKDMAETKSPGQDSYCFQVNSKEREDLAEVPAWLLPPALPDGLSRRVPENSTVIELQARRAQAGSAAAGSRQGGPRPLPGILAFLLAGKPALASLLAEDAPGS